jgi:hypothetical protein
MSKNWSYSACFAIFLVLCASFGFVFKGGNQFKKELVLKNEKELKVNLSAGFGDLFISRGNSSKILEAAISTELPGDLSDYIDYSSRDRVGYLNINTTETVAGSSDRERKHNVHFSGWKENTWDMHFTDAVPISYDLELGMGKGNLDFTGLAVKDLNISTGASSVTVRFDSPNKVSMDDMNIETGLSKFRGEGLCNANFRHFKFQGGVGSYSLDFAGQLHREADVDIEVGLGSLTVIVPREIGVKIYYEKSLIAHIDLPDDFSEREDDTYYSENFDSSTGKLKMHIEAGLGGVKIRRE